MKSGWFGLKGLVMVPATCQSSKFTIWRGKAGQSRGRAGFKTHLPRGLLFFFSDNFEKLCYDFSIFEVFLIVVRASFTSTAGEKLPLSQADGVHFVLQA